MPGDVAGCMGLFTGAERGGGSWLGTAALHKGVSEPRPEGRRQIARGCPEEPGDPGGVGTRVGHRHQGAWYSESRMGLGEQVFVRVSDRGAGPGAWSGR